MNILDSFLLYRVGSTEVSTAMAVKHLTHLFSIFGKPS